MRIWAAAIITIMLGPGAAVAQDCALKQYVSLPLEVYPDHLLVPVTMGTTPEKLVFNMQGAASGINSDTAAALDLRITSMPPNIHFHREGEEITRIAHVAEFHLGQQTLNNMEFLMLKPGRYGNGVVGDLGTQMFKHIDFELDMAAAKLNLFSSDRCPGHAVYWTQTGFAQLPLKRTNELDYIRAQLTLDGHPVMAAFSTTGRSRIGMNVMRRIFGVDETSPDLVAVNEDLLGRKLYRYSFKTLAADALTVTNPDIVVFDEAPRAECNDRLHFQFPDPSKLHSTDQARLARCFGGDDVVLGLSVLRKLHMFVSAKENVMYLTGADAK
jgi:hypothetical protein